MLIAIKQKDNDDFLSVDVSGVCTKEKLDKDFWELLSKDERAQIASVKALVIKLDGVETFDTSGLAWLVNLKKSAHVNKIDVTFEHLPDKLLKLAELSNVIEFLGLSKNDK